MKHDFYFLKRVQSELSPVLLSCFFCMFLLVGLQKYSGKLFFFKKKTQWSNMLFFSFTVVFYFLVRCSFSAMFVITIPSIFIS